MELTAAEVWSRILHEARAALPEQAYRTWLAPTEAVALSQDTLIVSTPSPFAADWVEDKYTELLTAIAEKLFGHRLRLTVQCNGAQGQAELPLPVSLEAPPAPPPAPRAAAPVLAA